MVLNGSEIRVFLSLCNINTIMGNMCFPENIRYIEKKARIYTLETLDIYTLPVRHICPTHWIYISSTSANYIQHVGK